ncbi:MAG: 30S ribosomal protein S7 [Dehalococcoidales bacterium]|nr:MAG: 30S ribosomal protein S7 [Dehalococcoidales bacterium]
MRRNRAEKREILPDSRYHNPMVSRLINKIMLDGKKSTAEKIVYGALDVLEERESQPAITVLQQAVRNATPQLQVKSRRIGGATYQVPVDVSPERSLTLALRWLVTSARARQGKSMIEKLAAELGDAAKGQGATVKKRDDTHRMAEANRAFAHYRW